MHYCFEWAGYVYDYTTMTQTSVGETIGNTVFFNPMNAQATACAFYYCAEHFFHMSEEGLQYSEMMLSYNMRDTGYNEINTDMDVSRASCSCNAELEAAYPQMNDPESNFNSATAMTCRNDLEVGGTRDGGWLWFCENLNCVPRDNAFFDYYTCTLADYYGVDWEACPTLDNWLTMNYGIGFGGTFINHLLTIFILCFLSFIPFIMIYSACCGSRRSNKLESGVYHGEA